MDLRFSFAYRCEALELLVFQSYIVYVTLVYINLLFLWDPCVVLRAMPTG